MANREKNELCHQLDVTRHEDEMRVRQTLPNTDVLGKQLPNAEFIWTHGSLGHNGYRIWDMAAPLFSLDLLRAAYRDLTLHQLEGDAYRFIGDLLEQTGITVDSEPHITVRNSGMEGSYCPEAEPFFYASWIQTLSGHRRGHGKVSVYHSADGEPILFRKNSEASTALTLQPMAMEGMPIASGTIVSPAYIMNSTMTGEKVFGRTADRYRLQTYELPQDIVLGLGRLSAWAFDDAETRMLFAADCYGDEFDADPRRARLLAETTLDDFRLASRHIMNLCGVAQLSASETAAIDQSALLTSATWQTLVG